MAEADAATVTGACEVSTTAVEPARIEPAVLSDRIAGMIMLRLTDTIPPQCLQRSAACTYAW
jgi:hypothetical protein